MPLTWRFSDGTAFTPPGRVVGRGRMAQEIRVDLEEGPVCYEAAPPCAEVPVDMTNPAKVHEWLADLARVSGVTMTPPAELELPFPSTEPPEPLAPGEVY